MLRLNIRHQLPQTSTRQRWSSLEQATITPAQIRVHNEQGESNQTATQPTMEIDSYQSRTAYGLFNMTDLMRRQGQKGSSDLSEATAAKSREAWASAENGGKRGSDIPQKFRNQMFSRYSAQTVFTIAWAADPTVTHTPSRIVGTPDVGDLTAEIDASAGRAGANIRFERGSAETYMTDQGFIRRWVSQDTYDIYA